MSREEKVSVVEAYLDCFVTKDLSKMSFAEDVTFEGPRMPKLAGRATAVGNWRNNGPEMLDPT
jgi:hypothetical protein